MNLEQFKTHLIDGYDPDQLVDLLGICSQELIEQFPDKVYVYYEETYGGGEDAEDESEEGW